MTSYVFFTSLTSKPDALLTWALSIVTSLSTAFAHVNYSKELREFTSVTAIFTRNAFINIHGVNDVLRRQVSCALFHLVNRRHKWIPVKLVLVPVCRRAGNRCKLTRLYLFLINFISILLVACWGWKILTTGGALELARKVVTDRIPQFHKLKLQSITASIGIKNYHKNFQIKILHFINSKLCRTSRMPELVVDLITQVSE